MTANILSILDILSYGCLKVHWVSISSSEEHLAWFYHGYRAMRKNGKMELKNINNSATQWNFLQRWKCSLSALSNLVAISYMLAIECLK